MSVEIEIKIEKDTATPAVKQVVASLSPERLAARVGPAVVSLIEQHLASLGPNKKGWPSTHFYEKFARNVRWAVGTAATGGTGQSAGAAVIIGILPAVINGRSVSLRQRIFGGAIAPVDAKALAIPISPVSYGHVPSDFPGLFMIKTPKGAYLVQYGQEGPAPVRGAGGRAAAGPAGGNSERRIRATINFLFKLSFGVDQEGDRYVLPSDDEIQDTAVKALLAGEN